VTRCWSLSQPNKYVFNTQRNCWREGQTVVGWTEGCSQPWSSNWKCPIAETSLCTWNNKRSYVRRSKLTTVGSCNKFTGFNQVLGS